MGAVAGPPGLAQMTSQSLVDSLINKWFCEASRLLVLVSAAVLLARWFT